MQEIKEEAWQQLLLSIGAQSDVPAPPARFNVAPTQAITALVWDRRAARAQCTQLSFGFAGGPRGLVINARAETLGARPMFRGLLAQHRCLVVASAFYEWAPSAGGGTKQPHCLAKSDGTPFCFAGLHARPTHSSAQQAGAVLVTTEANPATAVVHGRMPVMLDSFQARQWLDPRVPVADALSLLAPYTGRMRIWPVSRAVNSPRHDAPDCMQGG